MVLFLWLQCPVISSVSFKRPRPASCHFPSSLGRDGMGPLRPSCDSNQGCPAALLAPARKRCWIAGVEQTVGIGGGSLLRVRQEDFGWPMGKGLETGGPGKAGVCVCGLDMEGSLRVPLRPLGTVLDLRNLRRRLRSPFAPCSHAPCFLPHPCTLTRQDAGPLALNLCGKDAQCLVALPWVSGPLAM